MFVVFNINIRKYICSANTLFIIYHPQMEFP